jgi:hypothetical protein
MPGEPGRAGGGWPPLVALPATEWELLTYLDAISAHATAGDDVNGHARIAGAYRENVSGGDDDAHTCTGNDQTWSALTNA